MDVIIFSMLSIFKKFIYRNYKMFIIRFNENKKYIQGMFCANNKKVRRNSNTPLEIKFDKSINTIITDDFDISNLDNPNADNFV